MSRPVTLPEALQPLLSWLAVNAPGRVFAGNVVIPCIGSPDLHLPLPLHAVAGAGSVVTDWEPPYEDEQFIPTPFQQSILDSLDGKALRTDALGAKTNRNQLFKTNGLKELIEQGLVKHHKRIGYYRPDAPPPELQEPSSEE